MYPLRIPMISAKRAARIRHAPLKLHEDLDDDQTRHQKSLLQETPAEKVKNLMALAAEIGVPMPQLGVAWCLKNPNVSTVILGATKPEQLQETLNATNILPLLTEEVMNRIEDILQNKPQHPQY